jgi:hypothetical protein
MLQPMIEIDAASTSDSTWWRFFVFFSLCMQPACCLHRTGKQENHRMLLTA